MNEERMKILQMIEKGTISAEEGAKLLSAVEADPSKEMSPGDKKKYGIKHFIGDAVEKIKNADFDLSFGEYFEFDHESELDAADFQDADLSIANGSLQLHTWDKDTVKASYHVRVYQVETEEEARERFHDDGHLEIKNGLLRVASPSKKIKTNLELYVPKKTYAFVKAKLTNGSLQMDGLESDHFQLKTSNGPVELSNVAGDTCKIETGNGSITLTNGIFDTCETDTINGAISLGGGFAKSDASAVSGSITVNHTDHRAHTGFYKATTGSIRISLPTEKKIDGVLKTKFGSLYCQLDNYKILKDKKEVMNKQLEFEAYEQFEAAYHVEAETKTGSVTINPPVQL